MEKIQKFIKMNDINLKWVILSSLIIYSVNFFTGFVIGYSLNLAGSNDVHSFLKVLPFLTLVSYSVPFILITTITLILKFNWKNILYISLLFTILGVLENLIFGLRPFTLTGSIASLIVNGILFGLGKLFADLILKVATKYFNKKVKS